MTTSKPHSGSELQLYRVLQRANLLQYYDVFISQGGDDVQQLCEAGEEEFLEIMALVGMASKPLHVRRLQKALQEWVQDHDAFKQPLDVGMTLPVTPGPPGSILAAVQQSSGASTISTDYTMTPTRAPAPSSITATPVLNSPPQSWMTPTAAGAIQGLKASGGSMEPMDITGFKDPSPPSSVKSLSDASFPHSPVMYPGMMDPDEAVLKIIQLKGDGLSLSPTSLGEYYQPCLSEPQICAIAVAAERLAAELPQYQARPINTKKAENKEIDDIAKGLLPMDDPTFIEQVRKYSAIYGRFDSKRKNVKPMSLHEISVNEASNYLCRNRPALLTRRDDLFPLARQVVRDSGYQYSKGHSRGQLVDIPPATKRPRLELKHDDNRKIVIRLEMEKIKRETRMSEISKELLRVSKRQEELRRAVREATEQGKGDSEAVQPMQAELEALGSNKLKLITEQTEIIRCQRKANTRQHSAPKKENGQIPSPVGATVILPSESSNEKVYQQKNWQDSSYYDALYSEGLMIAQQNGMADYAHELKGLKDEPAGEEVDEQEEWNRSVDEDMHNLVKVENGKVGQGQHVKKEVTSSVMSVMSQHGGQVSGQKRHSPDNEPVSNVIYHMGDHSANAGFGGQQAVLSVKQEVQIR